MIEFSTISVVVLLFITVFQTLTLKVLTTKYNKVKEDFNTVNNSLTALEKELGSYKRLKQDYNYILTEYEQAKKTIERHEEYDTENKDKIKALRKDITYANSNVQFKFGDIVKVGNQGKPKTITSRHWFKLGNDDSNLFVTIINDEGVTQNVHISQIELIKRT